MDKVMMLVTPYIYSFSEFLSLALINKKVFNDLYQYMSEVNINETDIYARRTWISVMECQSCAYQSTIPFHQITYRTDIPPRRCIVTCDRWQCRVCCLAYFIYETFERDQILFFKPSLGPHAQLFFIPRANPKTITKGRILHLWDRAMIHPEGRVAGEYHIRLRWRENEKEYSKCVPFKKFIEHNPTNTKFSLRKIYNKILITKQILDNFP